MIKGGVISDLRFYFQALDMETQGESRADRVEDTPTDKYVIEEIQAVKKNTINSFYDPQSKGGATIDLNNYLCGSCKHAHFQGVWISAAVLGILLKDYRDMSDDKIYTSPLEA